MKGNTNSNITKQYVDDSISALGTWEGLNATLTNYNYTGNITGTQFSISVNRKLRLLNITIRVYLAVTTRNGDSLGINIKLSNWTNGANSINVKGSSPAASLNGTSETASVVANRGVFFEGDVNSDTIRMRLNESFSNISNNSVFMLNQNVMIPY